MQEVTFIQEYFISLLANTISKNIFKSQHHFSTIGELKFNLQLSQETLDFCEQYTSFSFTETPDIRQTLTFSQKDYILDIKDVYNTHLLLTQWIELTNLSIQQEEYPTLYEYIHELFLPKILYNYWQKTFDHEGNIVDSASLELKRIRALKKTLRKQIERILNTNLQSNEDLAEKRIAFREDRYVLPIKSVAKNRTLGIVHGFSSSGLISYIEPPEIITFNNELLSVDDLEQQEINRLLRQWSKLISEHVHDILIIIERSAQLEILFAKYHFSQKLGAKLGTINFNREIILERVYNPFLLIKKSEKEIVPINIELESENYGIIISGPNAGGKSAALKTLALCADMFLRGLPIPADYISLPLFSSILLEIGDSQNLDNDLSTFSGHLNHLKHILDTCDKDALVLIDEIAHATDPLEGEALGCAIIDELVLKECFFAITTHYKQVKLKSFEHSKIKTYATGVDVQTLMPKFILYPNTIGESYALNIATRIGISDHIIKSAELFLQNQKDKTELILSNIEEYEKKIRQKEQTLNQQQQELEQALQNLEKEKIDIINKINLLKTKGLEQADKKLYHCLQDLSAVQKNIANKPKESSKKLKDYQNIIHQKKEEMTNLSHKKKTHITIGESVFIASLNKKGIVEEILDNSIIIRTGIIKISVKRSDIFETEPDTTQKKNHTAKQFHTDISHQVDIHGMTVDIALAEVDKHLYRALVSGINEFTIVHGKGAGILQKAVHLYLKTIPEVKDFHFATPQNGGSGKTIVYFIY